MTKIVLISNAPTPYRLPLFSEIHRHLREKGYELSVIFLTGGYKRRQWRIQEEFDFPCIILNDPKVRVTEEKTVMLPFSLMPVLHRQYASLIITAGFSFASLLVWLYCRLLGKPYLLWSGEVAGGVMKSRWLRCVVRRLLIRHASSVIAYGTEAERYVHTFSPNARVFKAWNTVDTTYFELRAEKLRKQKDVILREFGASGDAIHLLTVGYLVHRKGIDTLLHAVRTIRSQDFILHVVGDGPERQKLEILSRQLNIQNRVIFWGYKQQEELPKYYAIADIFLFPTRFDIWGLVLEEAMACGLPVVASSAAGATTDLVKANENGFIVRPDDTEATAKCIERLMRDKSLRETFGSRSREIIASQFTLQHSAKAFVDAMEFALKLKPCKGS